MLALKAQDRVLQTPELLESIILQLPMRDLLVTAQRISKEWNQIIESSPSIQEALFFQPASRDSEQEQSFNPLLQSSFAPLFKNRDKNSTRCDGIPFNDLDGNSSDTKKHAYAREEASWRMMLPVHPPIRQLYLVKQRHAMGGDSETMGEAYFKDGIRMGNLYDLAQDQANIPITRVGINWVTEEAKCFVDTLTSGLALGKEKYRAVMTIHHTVQCRIGGPTHWSSFRSLGYEEVKVTWGPTTRKSRR